MRERARKLAAASAAGAAFLGFGLWMGGAMGRVSALVSAASSSPDISLMPGSKAETPRGLVLDGQPTRLRRCTAPKNASVAAVREFYESVALREGKGDDDVQLPYAALDQSDGAYVLWTSMKDGHRKGVIVTRDGGIVSYTLLDSEALPGKGGGSSTVPLPEGARAPQGAHAGLAVEDGASSFTFFDAPGSPDEVAAQVESSLAEKGFAVDADGVDPAASKQAARGRVVVPLRGKDKKGFLVVAAQGRGSSRATLVLR